MAPQRQHGLNELAKRLEDWADAIENPNAHEAEQDIRRAANILRDVVGPTPLVPRLVAEIKQIAARSHDAEAAANLRALLGDLG
jgi:hypothetical protein